MQALHIFHTKECFLLSDFHSLAIEDKTTGQHDIRDQETRGQGLFLPFTTMTSRIAQGPTQSSL